MKQAIYNPFRFRVALSPYYYEMEATFIQFEVVTCLNSYMSR